MIGSVGTRGLLRGRFAGAGGSGALVPLEQWRPFPRAGERAAWEGLPPVARAAAVRQGEAHLGATWPALPATLFLEFRRQGNRSNYEAPHFERRAMLTRLVLAECAEGRGRFLDDVINGIWALCEESFWGVPAHSFSPRFPGTGLPDTGYRAVDLFAAETGALLAWTHYLLGEAIGVELPAVLDRIEREVATRLLEPYRTVDDWRWLGKVHRPVNNWNPWIHSNLLACNLLLERDESRRAATVDRIVEGLDAFLDGYHSDGGCDEGPGYWGRAGASLFDCLELLAGASDGALDAFDLPLVQEIGRYIYRAHVAGDWYVNFADASARVRPDGDLVYRYGERIGDPRLMALGASLRRPGGEAVGRGTSIYRALRALTRAGDSPAVAAAPPLVGSAWLDGIQVLVAREREGSSEGLYLAAKGGHNAESHNHNDVGHFIVALDGHPVLIDVGVETYTRETFGPNRYRIWTMQSDYHNLPLVNGLGQLAGRERAARDVSADVGAGGASLTLDLASAYPASAGIETWRRTVRLQRGDPSSVVVADAFRLSRPPERLALHLMTSGPVDASLSGRLVCAAPGRPLLVDYPADALEPRVEEIAITDARLRPVWGERIFRVLLAARAPGETGEWTLTMTAGPAGSAAG